MMTLLIVLATAAEAYLLGSIDTGILVSKYLYHDDVRNYGSGAAGMTNMLRTFGKKAAALTASGDVLKGALAVCIGRRHGSVLGGGHFGVRPAPLRIVRPVKIDRGAYKQQHHDDRPGDDQIAPVVPDAAPGLRGQALAPYGAVFMFLHGDAPPFAPPLADWNYLL